MYCKRCKKENADNSEYCIYCGANLKEKKASKVILRIIGIIVLVLILYGIYHLIDINRYSTYKEVDDDTIFFKCPYCGEGNYTSVYWFKAFMDKPFMEKTGEGFCRCINCNKALSVYSSSKKVTPYKGPEKDENDNTSNTTTSSKEETNNNTKTNEVMGLQYPQPGELLPISPGLTGIEQAVKNGELDEDILQGTSKEMLTYIFNSDNGRLKFYYHSLEECLQDAEKLNILREPTEEELNLINGPTYRD